MTAGTATGPGPRWRIRMPTAQSKRTGGAPAFTLDRSLDGVRVGLRHEGSWRSWMLIVDEWESYLRRDGAAPAILQTGERVGDQGNATATGVDAWAAHVDCGISGLGTCGSCTSWSVHDAVTLEAAGKPAAVAVTEEFATHARNMAVHLGHPDLKLLVLPHPLEARPPDELRQIAADRYPDFLDLLGVKR